ncbi:Glycerol uptake facilitator protein [Posidoniimonas polymericola]|uniref:Glycerol uptake facilitator protein n=2 Tax=Posidoniimonas polymericola TaxID=2528002 RepID=A0A5C5YMA0_9BACT|nr:Glycerol uptake facilitator protein [Posidoniimonas polymericola]
MMHPYVGEFVGTMLLLMLGNGVNANVSLPRTAGEGSGWIVISIGWGMSVFVAAWCVAEVSGAHLNPAVTVGLAAAGKFDWMMAPGYIAAQLLGAIAGAGIMYAMYRDHFHACDDPDTKLGVFCTAPCISSPLRNLFTEAVGTAMLILAILVVADPSIATPLDSSAPVGGGGEVKIGLGTLGVLRVGLLVVAIGLCLGGPTGYAINPARDLGPRIAHALLPIPGKRDANWSYSWVPVVGPLLGGVGAALAYLLLW